MNCRYCDAPLQHTFLDLGFAPPSNAYLTEAALSAPEVYFPLMLKVCNQCWLVQTEDYTRAELLFSNDYAYFSSTSSSWLAHAADYAETMVKRLKLDTNHFVIEIASNDGYLLKNFLAAGIPCLGIEPTLSTAEAALKLGIPVLSEFFNETLATKLVAEGQRADLIVGNNVYAHVPDIMSFTRGLKLLLKPDGTITLEFPHLMRLIEHTQFDTVYHEHFSYLSLYTVIQVFSAAGLRIYDVEELPTHGGSLRVFGCHAEDIRSNTSNVVNVLDMEVSAGLREMATYKQFQQRVDEVKNSLLEFLIEQKRAGKKVVAYGAAAKGNTLLNYAGVKPDLIPFVCDAAVSKQEKYLPGSHIPILSPDCLRTEKPDIVVILPWNIASEVIQQNSYIRDWGGKFVTIIPFLCENIS